MALKQKIANGMIGLGLAALVYYSTLPNIEAVETGQCIPISQLNAHHEIRKEHTLYQEESDNLLFKLDCLGYFLIGVGLGSRSYARRKKMKQIVGYKKEPII